MAVSGFSGRPWEGGAAIRNNRGLVAPGIVDYAHIIPRESLLTHEGEDPQGISNLSKHWHSSSPMRLSCIVERA